MEAEQKKKARERELNRVKVADADIALVSRELDVDKRVAERRLRENGGDLARTLEAMIDAPPVVIATMPPRCPAQ